MITICIPVYNFPIEPLIRELFRQISTVHVQCEILVIDDCSEHFTSENKQACQQVRYIALSQNIGRAKIRNLFLQYATHEYLLFLDCDSLIYSGTFLLQYVEVLSENPHVVCGGRIYEKPCPSRTKKLRWKYGVRKESYSCNVRQQYPYRSFMTNNFLIHRHVLKDNAFDERITLYGHEDTVFGFLLKKKSIPIVHIDNPVTNGDIEDNHTFLHKTHEAMRNLSKVIQFVEYKPDLLNDIAILRFHKKISSIEPLIYMLFRICKPLLYLVLRKGYVSIYLFNFYKLGIFMEHLQMSPNKTLQ